MALFIVSTVPDHFLKEHLWGHVVVRHVPRLFAWTLGALALIALLDAHATAQEVIRSSPRAMVLLAALVALALGCTPDPPAEAPPQEPIPFAPAWWQQTGQQPDRLAGALFAGAADTPWVSVRLGMDIPSDWQYEDFRGAPRLPVAGALIYRFQRPLAPYHLDLRARPVAPPPAGQGWSVRHLVAGAQGWLSELPHYDTLSLVRPVEGIDLVDGQPVALTPTPHALLYYFGEQESMRRVWALALLDEPHQVLHLVTVVFASTARKEHFQEARQVLSTIQWVHILAE